MSSSLLFSKKPSSQSLKSREMQLANSVSVPDLNAMSKQPKSKSLPLLGDETKINNSKSVPSLKLAAGVENGNGSAADGIRDSESANEYSESTANDNNDNDNDNDDDNNNNNNNNYNDNKDGVDGENTTGEWCFFWRCEEMNCLQ